MDEDGQRHCRIVMRGPPLPERLGRAGPAVHHRRDELQMARVGGERDGDRLPVREEERPFGAVVILDVAGAALRRELVAFDEAPALEFGKDRLVRPADDVRQYVQSSAMRHPDDDFTSPVRRCELEREIEHGDQHVDALDREPLVAQVGLVEEPLEGFDLGEPREQSFLLVDRKRLAERARFDLLPEPHAFLVARDVLDLVAQGPTVGLLEMGIRVG